MDIAHLLRDLSQASGVSGYEEGARAVVRQAFGPYASTMRQDALGNLIALQRGPARGWSAATLDHARCAHG